MKPALLLAAALAIEPAAAIAQDEPPPIIVTAPGGAVDGDEADRLDVAAIAAGARPDLFAALQRAIPGFTLAEAQGNAFQQSLTWRGYGASPLQGTEQGVAVYIDGVRFNQPFGDTVLLDLIPEAALAAAELREASPLFGRNALGGALLLATHEGRSLPGLRARISGDSIGGRSTSLSVGTSGEAFDGLAIVEGISDPGWRRHSPSRLGRGHLSMNWRGERAGIGLRIGAAASRLTGNGVAPVELLAADYRAVFTRPDLTRTRQLRATLLPWIDLGDAGRIEGTLHGEAIVRRSVNGDLADLAACDAAPGLLCVGDEDSGFGELLRDILGRAVAVDPAVDDYAVFNRGRERTRGGGAQAQWLFERATDSGPLKIALGGAWERYRTHFRAAAELAELEDDRSVEGLGPRLVSDSGSILPVDVVSRLSDLALFASAAIPLAPRLGAELGLRWARNRVRLDDRLGSALDGSHRFARLNPSLELDYRADEALRLNVGYAETARVPTPAELSCADPAAPCALANFFVADPPLKQVVARNWHGGARFEKGAVTASLNLWRSDSRDDIRAQASTVRGRAFFANLGRSRKQGIELGLDGHRGPWRLHLDYALTDACFRDAFIASSPANPFADDDGTIVVERGDRLPGIPRHAANASLEYGGDRWSVAGSARYRGAQVYTGDEANAAPRLPGYVVFDATARLTLRPGIEVTGEIRNLFDKRYATLGAFGEIDDIALAEAPGASDSRFVAPAAPRRASIALSVRF